MKGLMKHKLWLYGLFFALLFGGFYLAMKAILPGYGTVQLPVLSYVKAFSFQNQYGGRTTYQDLSGKVYVAEYFFTTCKSICPIMNRNMTQVYERYKTEKDFMILSHSVDPETDSVGRMRFYADSLGVNNGNWLFLTGPKDSLYQAARISYLLDDPKNNSADIADQFIHTQFFALVDRSGQVRKIYDGLKKEELDEMIKDIEVLLKEKANPRFVNGIFNNNPG
jgi:protein SCO1/2